jgi:polar amino acid transport system substrate-binding protein
VGYFRQRVERGVGVLGFRPGRVVAAVLAAAGLLAGCGGGDPQPQAKAPGAVGAAVRPPGVQDPAPVPRVTASPPTCRPRASLRPRGALPAPGALPAGSTMDRIRKRGRLIAGVDQNIYLFGYRDGKSGQLVGYDIDYVREIARGIFGDPDKVQFRAVNASTRIGVLQRGEVDLIADSMTITCERLQQVAFTTDYFDSGQRVLVPRGSAYRRIEDLGGRKVCAPANTTSIGTIAAIPARPVPVAVPDFTDCLVLLQQGQVDAISTTDSILIGLLAQDPTTEMVGPRFTDEPHGLAIAKDAEDLVRFVNGVLEQMRRDGRWTTIYRRWLSALGPVPEPPRAEYLD